VLRRPLLQQWPGGQTGSLSRHRLQRIVSASACATPLSASVFCVHARQGQIARPPCLRLLTGSAHPPAAIGSWSEGISWNEAQTRRSGVQALHPPANVTAPKAGMGAGDLELQQLQPVQPGCAASSKLLRQRGIDGQLRWISRPVGSHPLPEYGPTRGHGSAGALRVCQCRSLSALVFQTQRAKPQHCPRQTGTEARALASSPTRVPTAGCH